MLRFSASRTRSPKLLGRTYIESVQITMAEDFGVQGRGGFYNRLERFAMLIQNAFISGGVESGDGAARPVRQRVCARTKKVKVLKAIPPIEEKNLVRGQSAVTEMKTGVAKDSQTETFAGPEVEINSWRWRGVPFTSGRQCCRNSAPKLSGKFRQASDTDSRQYLGREPSPLRLSPEVTIAWE